MMSDRPAMNELEVIARQKVSEAAQAMIDRRTSFFDGAREIFNLRYQVGGIVDSDPDFNVFVLIYSETDHLPYKDQYDFWSPDALKKHDSEFQQTEKWAESFAISACVNLITRFKVESE